MHRTEQVEPEAALSAEAYMLVDDPLYARAAARNSSQPSINSAGQRATWGTHVTQDQQLLLDPTKAGVIEHSSSRVAKPLRVSRSQVGLFLHAILTCRAHVLPKPWESG